MTAPIDVVWDMETGDPDDFITLLLLLGHPRVHLKGVTITPGTPAQVGVVRHALALLGSSIPVGAFDLAHGTPSGDDRRACVSAWHYKAFGDMPPSRDAVPGPALLRELCDARTTLVTGGPLKNLGAALALPGFTLGRLVAQGGFAGEGVVPRDRQLAKFRGLATCPTYNLDGDPRAALAAIASPAIAAKRFVSKNVCHGVVYDAAMHARVVAAGARSRSLALIGQGMQSYLPAEAARPRDAQITAPTVQLVTPAGLATIALADARARAAAAGQALVAMTGGPVPVCRLVAPAAAGGKKLHDPLAACCAIDESIGEWAEVELYRARGGWGARLAPGSGVEIIVGYDHEKLLATLTETAALGGDAS